MTKEQIQEIANNFIQEPYSDELLGKLTEKNHKKFLNGLSKLDERQIIKILKAYPEYSNKYLDGWHSLHFAALLNDPNVFDLFMKKAIENGLNSLPITDKERKGIPSNISFLNFCASNNCDKSYAKVLTYLSNPEAQDFNQAIVYCLHYSQPKVIKFLEKFIPNENIQKTMLTYFEDRSYRLDTLWKTKSFNIEKLTNLGINLKFELPEKKNYFTSVLEAMNNSVYEMEENGYNCIEETLVFFLEQGFSLDKPDGKQNIPRKQLENFINNLYSSSLQEKMEELMINLNNKSLNNDLIKNTNIEPKKLKI